MNSDKTVRHLVWTHWELICQWMNFENQADQLKMILITYEKKYTYSFMTKSLFWHYWINFDQDIGKLFLRLSLLKG